MSFSPITQYDVTLADRGGEFHTLTRDGAALARIPDEAILAQFGWRDGRSVVIAETNPYEYEVHLYVLDAPGKIRGRFNLPGWSLPGLLVKVEGSLTRMAGGEGCSLWSRRACSAAPTSA